mmetsp:Transcript_27201/g.49954  ORF Transcript_27201/g.49954 Transcript_27201/m.49954 type:complete len:145 (-) Transcript_27201:263-697(-)
MGCTASSVSQVAATSSHALNTTPTSEHKMATKSSRIEKVLDKEVEDEEEESPYTTVNSGSSSSSSSEVSSPRSYCSMAGSLDSSMYAPDYGTHLEHMSKLSKFLRRVHQSPACFTLDVLEARKASFEPDDSDDEELDEAGTFTL